MYSIQRCGCKKDSLKKDNNFQTMSTESDADSSISFSETVPKYSEEETERGKRDVITICNGADAIVYVELHPIQMVRRTKARKKNFGVGVDTAPLEGAVGVNMQVRCLFIKLETL